MGSKILVTVSVVIMCIAVTSAVLQHSEITSRKEPGGCDGPPDAVDMRLQTVTPNAFAVTWKRPQGSFDFYRIEMVRETDGTGGLEQYHLGSCATGTLLPANQTRVTCGKFETCTKATFTLQTLVRGPPERTSRGVSIEGFYIPGKAPEPPSKIMATIMTQEGTSSLRLDWEGPPESTSKCFAGYWVKVCELCLSAVNTNRCCWAEKTLRPSLVVNTTRRQKYWVQVSSGVLYGPLSMWSLPASL